jgi:hypothetical protein
MLKNRADVFLFFMALQSDCFNVPIPSFIPKNVKSSHSNMHCVDKGLRKLRPTISCVEKTVFLRKLRPTISCVADDVSFDAGEKSLKQENLDGFMLWAKTTGIICNKIVLNQLDSGERGCFATEDIFPGEIFLRVTGILLSLWQRYVW